MIQISDKLTIYNDDNSVFSDYSNKAADYGRGTFTITHVAADDSIYIGFYKPISNFYVELDTVNTNANDMSLSFYNGSAFTSVEGFYDDTEGFTRSGMIRWDRNQTSEATTTINSKTIYWYKINLSVDSSAIVFKGINIVFSDDQDLKREFFEIMNYLPNGETSHIRTHEASRDEIIQTLRADGRYKEDFATGTLKDITAFDLLDISQVKLAATYLALSKIMLNISEAEDDVFSYKHSKYASMYNMAMKTMYLNIDSDNDGIEDTHEQLADFSAKLIRR